MFGTFGSLPDSDGGLFSFVFIAFSVFWMLGWSVGVCCMAVVFLTMVLGRETLHVRDNCLILRIGIPGLGLGFVYPGTLIRNFRSAGASGQAGSGWRGEHLAFDFAGDTVAFASGISGTAADRELENLRRLFPDHATAMPGNLSEAEPDSEELIERRVRPAPGLVPGLCQSHPQPQQVIRSRLFLP